MSSNKQIRSKSVSERFILKRMKKWMCDGTHPMAITSEILYSKFGINEQSIRLMETFYKMYGKKFNLKRSFYVVKKKPNREDIVFIGDLVREDALDDADEYSEKTLYSIHRAELDRDSLIPTFPLLNLNEDNNLTKKTVKSEPGQNGINAFTRMTDESKKIKEANKIDPLFAKACEKEKFASPKGKKGLVTPPKPAADFFKPSPSRPTKDFEKAEKSSATRRVGAPEKDIPTSSATNFDDDDIYTTDTTGRGASNMDVDPDPIEKIQRKPKRAASPLKPSKSSKPDGHDDVENNSSKPAKMKVMRQVNETFVGEDGYLETRLVKKMIEVDVEPTEVPPPAKKSRTAAKDTGAKKAQASIMSFFKKV